MTGDTWLRFRLGLITLSFVVAIFAPVEQPDALMSSPTWVHVVEAVFLVVSLALIPVMLLFVISLQAANPFSDAKWTPPTHRSNPFRWGNPLLFFHFAAFLSGAHGSGLLVSSPWKGPIVAAYGAVVLFGAFMLLVGVRLCMRVFKSKMESIA